jgi:hypothetical protein
MTHPILREIEEFLEKYPDAEWSFGHIVLSDLNLSHHHIQWCLGRKQVCDWLIHKSKEMPAWEVIMLGREIYHFLEGLLGYSDDELEAAENEYHGGDECE